MDQQTAKEKSFNNNEKIIRIMLKFYKNMYVSAFLRGLFF